MLRPAAPTSLRFEHRTDEGPVLGLGTGSPRLSWQVPAADADYAQSAYEVEITRTGVQTKHAITSAEQILVPWPTHPLASRESAEIRIRVRDRDREEWSDWSEPAVVEAGLLQADD